MDLNFKGKIAWVTGATGALGKAICETLAQEGATVCASARTADTVQSLAAELGGLGVPMDATDPAQAKAAAETIVGAHGRIDILVNSVAVPAFGQFVDLEKATFQAALDTKYLGYVACMQAALPSMLTAGSGSIVNVTGTGGRMPIDIHVPGGSVNAALNLVTKALANQYGPEGVRVNAISPGPVRSPRQDQMQAEGKNPADGIPLKRFGEAAEVADAVAFMASDRASYITGSILQLDGGGILSL